MTDWTADVSRANQSLSLEIWNGSVTEPVRHKLGSCGVTIYLPENGKTEERRKWQKLRRKKKSLSLDTFQVPCFHPFLPLTSIMHPDIFQQTLLILLIAA